MLESYLLRRKKIKTEILLKKQRRIKAKVHSLTGRLEVTLLGSNISRKDKGL